MSDDTSTTMSSLTDERERQDEAVVPAVVCVFSVQTPLSWVLLAAPGKPLILGRTTGEHIAGDKLISRRHASITFTPESWSVEDLGSSHGTFVDGARVDQRASVDTKGVHVLRLGRSLFLLEPNAARFGRAKLEVGEIVIGPATRVAFNRVERVGQAGRDLLITGERGTGKEIAAKHFHASGPRAGAPFIPVNCSALENLADSLLFGAMKGAFSGSVRDTKGYVRAASGGVMFLDELGDLPALTQSKVLRLLQSREAQPIGADRPEKVDLQICAATNRDLGAGLFREDLLDRFYNQGHVHLPPLRRRKEEIPFLIDHALRSRRAPKRSLTVSDALVEMCLLEPWKGNVRALVGTIERAALEAEGEESDRLRVRHLEDALRRQSDWIDEERRSEEPAVAYEPTHREPEPAQREPPSAAAQVQAGLEREQAEFLKAYERAGFNAAKLAQELNVARSTVTRRLEQYGVPRRRK